jgi:hypothetical protein
MRRRDLLQTLLGAAATAAAPVAAVERPAGYDASKELARPDWKPSFLDDHQDRTLIVLSDLIIPATDTPGAKDALVNRFLDKLMASEKEATQREFLASLAYIDGESMRQYKAAFIYLPGTQQLEFLTFLAYPHSLPGWGEPVVESEGHNHFQHLKQWISSAYYSSEAGLRELAWDGTFPHGELTGCGDSAGGAKQNTTSPGQAGLVHISQPKA